MTDLEKMNLAKTYIDKLANGIDPITDMVMEKDAVLNNVRLSRCFFYVSEILGEVIKNGGVVLAAGEKAKFHITDEEKAEIMITDEPVGINELARRVNAVIDSARMQGATGVKINNWLTDEGYLRVEKYGDKQLKVADEKGKEVGIRTVEITAPDGRMYKKNIFGKDMQQYIVDRINMILSTRNNDN